jgi:hypothetical protein
VNASSPGVLSAAAGGGGAARAVLMMRSSCEVRLQGKSSQERDDLKGSVSAAWRRESSSLDARRPTEMAETGLISSSSAESRKWTKKSP